MLINLCLAALKLSELWLLEMETFLALYMEIKTLLAFSVARATSVAL